LKCGRILPTFCSISTTPRCAAERTGMFNGNWNGLRCFAI
jgi:hypothetical protein